MRYTIADKQQVQDEQHLDELPDDEFMAMLAEANTLALTPRVETDSDEGTTPNAIRRMIDSASLGALLSRAEAAANCSHAEVGRLLGVTRQRVGEILDSDNMKVDTLVRFAAACGYDTEIVLRPIARAGDTLTALLPGRSVSERAMLSADGVLTRGTSMT